MQIKTIPQSYHSGKRWIWLLEALINTNPSKKLRVPTISGFTMGHIQLATRLIRLQQTRQLMMMKYTMRKRVTIVTA